MRIRKQHGVRWAVQRLRRPRHAGLRQPRGWRHGRRAQLLALTAAAAAPVTGKVTEWLLEMWVKDCATLPCQRCHAWRRHHTGRCNARGRQPLSLRDTLGSQALLNRRLPGRRRLQGALDDSHIARAERRRLVSKSHDGEVLSLHHIAVHEAAARAIWAASSARVRAAGFRLVA